MTAKLESWSVLSNQSDRLAHGAKMLRKKCVSAIHDGLGEITGKDDLAMNYLNYETAIVARYKVRLIGWPSHIPFTNPSSLRADHLQRLADALDSQECRWQVMSGAEINAHNAQFDADAASGMTVGKPRKQRSDKEKKRTGEGRDGSGGKKRKTMHGKQPNWSRQLFPSASNMGYMNFADDMHSG